MSTRSTAAACRNPWHRPRQTMLGGLAILFLAAGLAFSNAQATYEFNLPAQGIADALREIGRVTATNILFDPQKVGLREAPGLKGNFTADGAVEKVIAGMGLEMERMNDLILIRRMGEERTSLVAQEADVRVAEGQSVAAANEANGSAAVAGEKSEDSKLQEVVVTAQKRKERLQDVPISMSVLSGRDLDRSNYVSVNDALNVSTPGVATSYGSFPGTTQLSVRGVSAPQMVAGGASPIAYYVDSVPFGFVRSAMVPDVGSFDLQQVEALRGPQGSLYGANAANGVVRVITNDADLNKVEFKARSSVSNTQDGSASYRADAAVNIPIVEDKLAARVTGSYANAGGWIDNLVKRDTNDIRLKDVRLKLNARPSDDLSLGLSWWHSETDIGAFNEANSDDLYPGILDTPTRLRFDAIGLKVGYQFPGISVSSATSYIAYKNHNNYDISPFEAIFGPNDPTWFGQLGFNKDDSKVFAQEITLTSRASGSWRWTAGAFYRDAEDHYFSTAIYFTAPQDYGDISRSVAAFGELTREFSGGKFELTGGLRYFRDRVTVTNVDPPQHDTDTFHHVSPRVVLSWHPSAQMTAYTSYAEGFRSGFSQDAYSLQALPSALPVKPDRLHNYEMGLKGELLGGRITYDTAVYYMDWKDVQQHISVPAGVDGAASADVIVNGHSASGPGIDLNVMTRPLADLGGFELGVNASWNDLKFDEAVLTGADQEVLFRKGDRLAYSPEYTLGALAAYSFPFGGSGLQSRLSISGSYHSKQVQRQPGVTYSGDDLLNVHAGFSLGAPERWTTELFVDNATNNRGNITRDFVPIYDLRTRPRTIGLQVDYRFSK